MSAKPKFSLLNQPERHFFRYVFRVDRKFHRALVGALIALIIATISVATSTTAPLMFVIAILGFTAAFWCIWDVKNTLHNYAPEDINNIYFSVPNPNLPFSNSKNLRINDLSPSLSEREQGFRTVQPAGTDEVAHTSPQLNTWLSAQPEIIVEIGKSQEGIFNSVTSECKFKKERISFLRSLAVNNGATNELKYKIDSIPQIGSFTIGVRKVGYFDAMVTNQCTNIELKQKPWGTEQSGTLVADLRETFPLEQEVSAQEQKYCLSAYGTGPLLANSVGVSALVVTSDNYPIFFYQKDHNVEGAGKLTVLGSGSADFADIDNSNSKNLLDILKFGMIREAMEEGSLTKRPDASNIRRDAIENTMVIGFFRWVRRAGKPEFLGVTKIGLKLNEVVPDNVEVAELQNNQPLKLTKMSDFLKIVDLIEDAKTGNRQRNKFWIGLSGAMVLWRLSQIANATDANEIATRRKVAKLLGIKDE